MLRFDDQFPLHRKVDGLTDSGFRMHVEAIFWCARNLTDGFIAQDDLGSACRYRKPEGYLAECVKRGAWHRVENGRIIDGCAECSARHPHLQGDGWVIHGYLDWQQERSKVLQIRDARARAGKLGGQRSGAVRRGKKTTSKTAGKPKDRSKPEANAKQSGFRSNEPPIPSPSKEGNRGSAPASPGGAPPPTPPGPPTAPNGSMPNHDRRAQLAAQARAAIRKPPRPARDPFQPKPDKAQQALDALTTAVAELPPPPETPPQEASND